MAPPPAAAATVVLIDFLGLGTPLDGGRGQPANLQNNPEVLARRGGGGGGSGGSSIRDIQKAVSRMDPDVLRSLITAAPDASRMPQLRRNNITTTNNNNNIAHATAPIHPLNSFASSRSPIQPASDIPAAPAPAAAPAIHHHNLPSPPPQLAPLTIFYDGAVSVFDVPPQVADLIIKTAETSSSLSTAASAISIAETLVADAPLSGLPLARKKSLRRFLEKRQLRLTSAAPYTAPSPTASSSTAAGEGEVVLPAPATASSPEDLRRSECNMWAMADVRRRKQQQPSAVERISRTTSSNSSSSSFSAAAIAGAAHVTGAW